ncbi:MAG: YigZ family protein [Calditrichales bacterium]|nr:MAG: YigZ family protein [Calditrichales bacterium]
MTTSSSDNFFTVSATPVSAEIKIKGSKFIGHIFHVVNKSQAESVYDNMRRKYYDATHNCYAYRISADEFRYSDDGEPSGTAGKPIFQVLEGADLIKILIIVTRYFGGTKLGTGGLIRAYGDAAKTVLSQTRIEKKTRYITQNIESAYENLSILLELVSRFKGIIGKTEYTEKIVFSVQIPISLNPDFNRDVDSFSGRGLERIIVDA